MKKLLIAIFILFASTASAGTYNIVIEVQGGLNTADPSRQALNPGVSYELWRVDAEYADGGIAPGTVVVPDRKLIVSTISLEVAEGENPADLVELLFLTYNQPWNLLGMQSLYRTVPVYDNTDPDNPVEIDRIATVYKPLDPSILNYIPRTPIKDENDVITGYIEPAYNRLPTWAGEDIAPWVY